MWVTIKEDVYNNLLLWMPWKFIMCVHCLKQKSEIPTYVVHWKLSISVSIYVSFCNQKRHDHMQVTCSISLKRSSRHVLENILTSTRGCTCFLWIFCQGNKWLKGALQAWDRTNGWYSAYNKERKIFYYFP